MPSIAFVITLLTICTSHAACQRVTPTTSIGGSQVTPAPANGAEPANAQLPPPSYSGTFMYTTPTTSWRPPTFPTSAPGSSLPRCTDNLCPSQNGRVCQDSLGGTYGVLCNTRFSGTIIVSSGKKEKAKKMRRGYAGTLDNCSGFCDMFSAQNCLGVDYDGGGYCMAYASIFGTLSSPGKVALVRLS